MLVHVHDAVLVYISCSCSFLFYGAQLRMWCLLESAFLSFKFKLKKQQQPHASCIVCVFASRISTSMARSDWPTLLQQHQQAGLCATMQHVVGCNNKHEIICDHAPTTHKHTQTTSKTPAAHLCFVLLDVRLRLKCFLNKRLEQTQSFFFHRMFLRLLVA